MTSIEARDPAVLAARTYGTIFLFWVPLAAQWFMMALEGPFLAAVIARMGDPTFNLAAFGVAFAFAILVESPVIMLMSASTALVEDAASYRRLRNFANALNAGCTLLLLLVLIPQVYVWIMDVLIGLPPEVSALVYGALWFLLPWPAAIGYRRFLHGVLIRSGRTRMVAYGTVFRLVAMASVALGLYVYGGLPGAWVGAAALSAGVCVEAVAARIMAMGAIRRLLAGAPASPAMTRPAGAESGAESGAGVEGLAGAEVAVRHQGRRGLRWLKQATIGYADITRFYYPLALTSLIGLSVHPMLTFFMGRAPMPVESLAVFPVVLGLSFLFRAPGFSYQEVVIALVGGRFEHVGRLARFGMGLAILSAGGLALVAFTPLAYFWFETVSGLPPELAAVAVTPARIVAVLPAVAVALSFQHAVLVKARRTAPITAATVVEVVAIALLFPVLGWYIGITGASAAMLALVSGRVLGNLYLVSRTGSALRDRRVPA